MNILLQSSDQYVLRFDRGEEVFLALQSFAENQKIGAAFFSAIGASQKVVLSYYDLEQKKYFDQSFEQDLEIVSMTGNIGKRDGKVALHAHGCFSDKSYQTFAGHIKELVVSATCEMMLTKLSGTLTREFDEATGLNLLHIHD